MINVYNIIKKTIKEHNSNWKQILDHPYRILVTKGSGSGETNSLFNLINQQPDIDKIYLCATDPYKEKYPFWINKWESTGSKYLNDSEAFIEYLNNMDDLYKNIEEHKKNKNFNCS